MGERILSSGSEPAIIQFDLLSYLGSPAVMGLGDRPLGLKVLVGKKVFAYLNARH